MKNEDEAIERDELDELLAYLHGCAEDPAAIEARLAADATLRARLEEARATQELLARAAREPSPALELAEPRRRPAADRRRPTPFGSLRAVAAVLLALLIGIPLARWGLAELRVADLSGSAWRLVVSGPAHVPDGAPARVRAQVWDADGEPCDALVRWTVRDAETGAELGHGEEETAGALDIDVAAALDRPRKVELVAERGGIGRTATLELAADRDNPLVHLASDKPAYRPGETVWMRAVLLNRLSLAPRAGNCRLRLVDPKGAPVASWVPDLEEGVAAVQWTIPEEAAGGEYALELRDAADAFTVERLPLLVRHYQTPRLAQTIDLDKETYAPGESGSAELSVERVEGGIPAGAAVVAALVLDGEEVWSESGTLDGAGHAVFRFTVPEEVERGEARLVCRTTDGGVVETALEPFVVPTGKLDVAFYPEGGDLVAGVSQRVYAEVTDTLGRPADARGRVVDSKGAVVASFETLHEGRARFELVPRAGERYRLEIDEPDTAPVDLPAAVESGVVLRASADATPAGEAVAVSVTTPGPGPWIAGVFCRGVLVAQDAFEGAGEHALAFPLPQSVAGVLRVTVFDGALSPAAERLVQRESGRAIRITVEPDERVVLPGAHQGVKITTRDEAGRPVACVLGVSVFDRAVRDMVGETRVGLADQTWLAGDVEGLEDVQEFVLGDADARRNVDLLLGTRGWRRFAWFDTETVLAANGEKAQRLLLREGRPQVPEVRDVQGDGPMLVARARADAERARVVAVRVAAGAVGLVLLGLVLRFLAGRELVRRRPVLVPLGAIGALVLMLGGLFVLSSSLFPWAREASAPFTYAPFAGGTVPPEREVAALQPSEVPVLENRLYVDKNGIFPGAVDALQLAAVEEPRVLFMQAGVVDEGIAPPDAAFGLVVNAGEPAEAGRLAALGYGADGGEEADALFLGKDPARFDGVRARRELVYAYARVYAHRNARQPGAPRSDFAETVYWNALLKTAADGTARADFDLSDRVTTWSVVADAHGAGRVGQGTGSFEAVTPFRMEAKLPVELTQGDEVRIPVALVSGSASVDEAELSVRLAGPIVQDSNRDGKQTVGLESGRARVHVPIAVVGPGDVTLGLAGSAGGWRDGIERRFRVVPRGFPQVVSKSGVLSDSAEFVVALPEDFVPGSLEVGLKLYPSPLADLLDGLDGLLQEPNGCFEQASSANYPNLLALAYLQAAGADEPAAAARARELLAKGYARITGYECSKRGYEWFGGDPGHEALSAYGLLEFHDMARVYDVDREMVARTRAWLLGRRDGKGGYLRNDKALDSFGRAPQEVTDAYVTYALAVTGEEPANIAAELDRLEGRALESGDPYEVALAASALQAAGRGAPADGARERLKEMQGEDGGLVGTTSSITRSGGADLAVETTSLAILAWLDDEDDRAYVERAVEFLLAHRGGRGTFGATQATIQALRALTRYAEENRRIAHAGEVRLFVNDYPVDTIAFEAGRRGGIVFPNLADALKPGSNRVRIELSGENEFPWSFEARYTADQPADDPEAAVAIRTALAADRVEEGKTVALTARIENLTDEGQPMTLAIIGVPAGLEVPTQVLDDLREARRFDLWELREREIVLYWRDLAPGEAQEVTLDLVARIPGKTTGPASRSYLYYTPQAKRWSEPLSVEVVEPGGKGGGER